LSQQQREEDPKQGLGEYTPLFDAPGCQRPLSMKHCTVLGLVDSILEMRNG